MDPQTVALILTALGGGAGLNVLIRGIADWRSGEHQREKERNRDAFTERDAALVERNKADRQARIALEHAAIVRRIALEEGIPSDRLPPWPDALKE